MNTVYPRTNTMAVISLIFGILCWVILPFVGAIVAIVCGHLARGEIRRAPAGSMDGDSMALIGLVLGWVHVLLVFLVIAFVFMFLGGLAFFGHWFH